MSNTSDEQRAEFAAAFDRNLDPLAEYESTFEQVEADPFALYLADVIEPRGLAENTYNRYRRTFQQWREFMTDQDRHSACPNERHVKGFVRWRRKEFDNHPDTIKKKLGILNGAYQFWQNDPGLPHPQDYNPIETGREKVDLQSPDPKEPPRLTVDDLREKVGEINHIRDRAIVAVQLKLGLRATEVCNIKLADFDIQNSELHRHYPELGSHPQLEGRENAIYVPSREERDGNKSHRPRVLPLDDELRRALLQYLLMRPSMGRPWLFLSKTKYQQLYHTDITDIWTDYFHPEYEETEQYDSITSHFGRHRFSTYWKIEQDIPRELVQYMRGDKTGNKPGEGRAGIDHYLHTYYEDIEPLYRERIYKLRI